MNSRWRRWRVTLLIALFAIVTVGASAQDLSATIQTKRAAILGYLHDLEQHNKTMVGVHVNEYEVYLNCTSADRFYAMTGAHPAILGLELMNAIAYPPYESYLVDRALTQTAAGGLVTMSWHERNPVEVCTRGEFYDCAKKPMSAETLQAVLTPGTPEHKLWLADVDTIAKVLGDLRQHGVIVLFRPYHEMNGDWFWWGKKDAFPDLWDALYDELAVRHKLDNLIWVWSADRDVPDAAKYYPRRHKPDVVGIDVYEHDPDNPKYLAGHASATALGGRTPFALTEVGLAPSRKVMDAVNPAWVLLWGEEYLNADWAKPNSCDACNRPEQVKTFVKQDRIVTLDKLPKVLRVAISNAAANEHPLHRDDPICPSKLR